MFNRWTRIPAVIVSAIAVMILILFILSKTSSTTEPFDLNKFCDLKTDKKQPEWLIGESDHVNYVFDQEEESKSDITMGDQVWDNLSVKGAFYMVVENTQLQKARESIRSIQDRFNSNSSYPWIILNSQKFTPEFKKYIKLAALPSTHIYFGQIDLEAWSLPYWIDSDRVDNAMKHMLHYQIENANSQYYHKLQRYQAGLFIHHPLFDTVDYVWHVEPGTTYSCQMQDPFKILQTTKKKIGFALTFKEEPSSMFSLWPATLHFIQQYSHVIRPTETTIMPWLITSKLEFNFCHISSSFQIVETSFLRSEEYQLYFHYLDLVGGFFYERWTASSIQTIASAMFLKRKDLHFFNDVGYAEKKGEHCPFSLKLLEGCACDYQNNYDVHLDSCTIDLLQYISPETIDEMEDFARLRIEG